MIKTFHIEAISNAEDGVIHFIARLESDFNASGIPFPGVPSGRGESEWEAIARLCAVLHNNECEEDSSPA